MNSAFDQPRLGVIGGPFGLPCLSLLTRDSPFGGGGAVQARSHLRGETRFDASGKRASIAIVRSSGHDILDQQALDTLTRAFVPVPPALRGREFAVEIPVIFDVQDERVSG
jgi:TonB family protein